MGSSLWENEGGTVLPNIKDANRTDHQKRVEELMVKAGQEIPDKPTIPSEDVRRLRANLILEEALETIEALGFDVNAYQDTLGYDSGVTICDPKFNLTSNNKDISLEEIADGCADVSVVTIGTLSACGIKDRPILEEVDANNLQKFGPGGYRRDDGKWVKPPNHPKPKIKELLEEQLR